MDPTELLRLLREDMARLKDLLDPPGFLPEHKRDEVVSVADAAWQHFQDLDGWIKRGGFLPEDWAVPAP